MHGGSVDLLVGEIRERADDIRAMLFNRFWSAAVIAAF
jgi:hypothetical protein